MTARQVLRWLATRIAPGPYETWIKVRSARAAAMAVAREWDQRAADAMACPDNKRLPRHPDAGRRIGRMQVMFNGVKVYADGYYGNGMTRLLELNRGSHEPQEELVFLDVLSRMPEGAQMLECGAYWGFYAAWFKKSVPGSRVWLVEPEEANLEVGRANFAANGLDGHFTRAFVGRCSDPGPPPRINVDDFMAEHQIGRLDILHADIQGAELEMIHGASQALAEKRVDFVFISTHGSALHEDCVRALGEYSYEVPVSVRPEESFSVDGLVVAHRQGILASPLPVPSLKRAAA